MNRDKNKQEFTADFNRNVPITKPTYSRILLKVAIAFWFFIPILLLRPFKKIYFAPLQTGRIGHFIMDTEILLARIYVDQIKARKSFLVIWIPESHICNQYAYAIWKRKINIVSSNLLTEAILVAAIYLEKVLKIKLTYKFIGWDGYLTYVHLLEDTPTVFSMSYEEEEDCIRTLEFNGIDTSKKWVCILGRDNTYLNRRDPDLHWDYNSYRNSNIGTYKMAAEYLATEGIITFRMGLDHEKTFSSEISSLVFDYANAPWRSEKLDIYLASKCMFFVSSATGIDSVPIATRKPLVLVNLAQPLHVLRSKQRHIFITKYFYFEGKNKYLNASNFYKLGIEIGFTIDNPIHLRSQDFAKLGITVIDNSEIEIKDAVAEMYELLTKTDVNKSELDSDQLQFWRSFPRDHRLDNFGPPRARIGKNFLKQNPWLLD